MLLFNSPNVSVGSIYLYGCILLNTTGNDILVFDLILKCFRDIQNDIH
jgi:hypothetical protein